MKTIKSKKKIKVIFAALVLFFLTPSLSAYPPDNAAVLYYKAFMLYESPDNIGPMLWDYWKGNIESNEKIEEFLKKNRRIIDIVLDATRIDHCDWGLDYSQGTEVLLPPHHKARQIFALLAAEARMQADRGDYKKALARCISIYRMARHLNERPLICYLVGTAINAATHNCITRFLSEMPPDIDTLTWLRDEFAEFDKQPYSVKPALRWKCEAGIISMSPERIGNVVRSGLDDGDFKEKILQIIATADEQFFERNRIYWNQYMADVISAFDLPYPQAYSMLQWLDEKPSKEFGENPDATLTVACAPPWQRIYVQQVRLEAKSNAIRTAVDVYLTKAATGRLPKSLPAGVASDPYTGKSFQYAKTADGFVLRGQAKNLDKVTFHQYEFKVKK